MKLTQLPKETENFLARVFRERMLKSPPAEPLEAVFRSIREDLRNIGADPAEATELLRDFRRRFPDHAQRFAGYCYGFTISTAELGPGQIAMVPYRTSTGATIGFFSWAFPSENFELYPPGERSPRSGTGTSPL